jgi:hypothetical protein
MSWIEDFNQGRELISLTAIFHLGDILTTEGDETTSKSREGNLSIGLIFGSSSDSRCVSFTWR